MYYFEAFIEVDGQTTGTGNTPNFSRDGASNHPVIENRNLGCRVVCGPIDKWISISTNNLIPGGANVLIEASRIAIELLAEILADIDLILPKKLFVQYDNSGENKVSISTVEIYLFIS